MQKWEGRGEGKKERDSNKLSILTLNITTFPH
jgi:hypothetical protein